MADISLVTISVEMFELARMLESLTAHGETNYEVLECFEARFPSFDDVMEVECVELTDVGLVMYIKASEAFSSFMQDLV
jgi:hypothetical protein